MARDSATDLQKIVYDPTHRYLLAGDETVENKVGKATHGIGLFYSSIFKRAINSVSFLNLSLIDTSTEKSSMIACRQIIRERNLGKKQPPKKGQKRRKSQVKRQTAAADRQKVQKAKQN